MIDIGFAAPAVLGALVLLPLLWWLLRATPPRPQDVTFAPTRLLMRLMKREETPSKTPWWLLLLRLALAALVIVALAQPVLRPEPPAAVGEGPMLVVVDNTFAAAAAWPERVAAAERVVTEAAAADRAIIVAGTAQTTPDLSGRSAAAAREVLRSLEPQPWRARRAALASRIAELETGGAAWIADGLGTADDAGFFSALDAASATPVRVFLPEPGGIVGVSQVTANEDGLTATLVADADPGRAPRTVRVLDERGFVLASGKASFEPGDTTASADIALPTELRNDAVRLSVTGERSAAAVRLLDDRFRRRTVGLVSGGSVALEQPLLSPLHYLRAALGPFTDLREPSEQELPRAIDSLIDAGTSVIALADVGTLLPSTRDTLARWINAGGVLLRFAGPRTADGVDALVPVEMRDSVRTMGGTLSWEEPLPLTDFAEDGPFADLAVPDDVRVTRQHLAEPSIALTERTWAALADGTPLVTGRNVGAGWVVYVHVTADTSWSTLPLSATFVEMLRAMVDLATVTPGGGEGEIGEALAPYRMLDGAGRLVTPGSTAEPLTGTDVTPGPRHPPGLYGADGAFVALNLLDEGETLEPIEATAFSGARIARYTADGPTELKGILMTLAAVLLLADAIAILALMGAFRGALRGAFRWRTAAAAVIALALLPLVPSGPAAAQERDGADEFALRAALETRLAYVNTGDGSMDRASEAGLKGLSRALFRRTAVEPGDPVGVNLESDPLAFFPLLYWPVNDETERPSDAAIARVDAYMRNGGTILFDTRDQGSAAFMSDASPATLALRRVLSGLDIPSLEPVPDDHVLTKTFYLLDDFDGRWSGSPLWVEALTTQSVENRPARAGDGVSPILITANNMAGAWAIRDDGSFMFPTVPDDPRQREMALRAGINIVIYTMTGNYKADQVHIPALLERLGQ